MRLGQRRLGVLGDRLVELVVLLVLNLRRLSRPNRLRGVDQLPVPGGLLHLARLGLLLALLLHLLHLGVLVDVLLLGFLFLLFSHLFLLLNRLLNRLRLTGPEVDLEVDKLAVLSNQVAEGVRLQEVLRLLLEGQRDGGSPLQRVAARVLDDGEGRRVRLPDVLRRVVVRFAGHHHLVGHQKGRVEADAKLADQVAHLLQVFCFAQLGEEVRRARLGDGTEVGH